MHHDGSCKISLTPLFNLVAVLLVVKQNVVAMGSFGIVEPVRTSDGLGFCERAYASQANPQNLNFCPA